MDCSHPSAEASPAAEWVTACDRSLPVKYLLKPVSTESPGLLGSAVSGAHATIQTDSAGTTTGQRIVDIALTDMGHVEFARLTQMVSSSAGCPDSRGPQCQLAFVLDGVVQSAPVILERIPGDVQISGDFTEQAARQLAAVIGSGTLPAPLRVVSVVTAH